jgi:lysyl-tRNA synthetase class 2
MASEAVQAEQRRAKLDELIALGVSPYPVQFDRTHTVSELVATFGETSGPDLEAAQPQTRAAGRILSMRTFGKANFLEISDGLTRLQVYVRADSIPERDFEIFKRLDLGDLIGVDGTVFRTRTGELTVEASALVLLAKCLHPLPEKWHGLTDVEIRYRKRYLDLIANGAETRQVFLARAKILAGIRKFLVERDYVEVETPILQSIAGGAAARPFLTHHNTLDMDLQLRIAPELFLKRLLVGGFERVFEIGRNFRNEGISTQHNPEFTMLEFYQAYATWEDLLPLVEEMFGALARAVTGGTVVKYGEHEIDLGPGWKRLSLIDEAARAAGCTPAELRDADRARAVAAKHGVPVPPGAGAGGIATALFEHLVESSLVQPTFVTGFPAEVSPLARASDDDPFVVDRFELYVAGRELANGFSELNDPDDQRGRFLAQLENRGKGDDEAHPMDEDYVHALEHGMPPAAGCGVGIDRLVMLLCNAASIRDVILFPLLRPIADFQ